MKRIFVLLIALFLLAGICGCSEKPETTAPDATLPTVDNAPVQSQPEESQDAKPVATAPQPTLPPGAPQGVKPQPTTPQPAAPQATAPGATEPAATEPQATKPQHATVPAGIIVKQLTCIYSIGNGSEKVVENPVASDLYQFVCEARSNAVRRNPSGTGNTEVIHLSFKMGEKVIRWMDIYADDYAAIPVTVELPTTQFYLLPSGTYQTILNTLKTA